MNTTRYWVYILNCENDTYYTGYTTDMVRRYQEHVRGSAKCKYTRSFKPLNLAQSWKVIGTKAWAMKIEKFIKKMSRKEKQLLILYPERLAQMFQCKLLPGGKLKENNVVQLNEEFS